MKQARRCARLTVIAIIVKPLAHCLVHKLVIVAQPFRASIAAEETPPLFPHVALAIHALHWHGTLGF